MLTSITSVKTNKRISHALLFHVLFLKYEIQNLCRQATIMTKYLSRSEAHNNVTI